MKSLFLFIIIALTAAAYLLWPEKVTSENGPTQTMLPAISLGPCEPIPLKSSNGHIVQVTAIHKLSPEGLTFSPVPDSPLIGSNQLKTITTQWENINPVSMSPYRNIYNAYQRARAGETVNVEWGPHYYLLTDASRLISRTTPKVHIYYNDGSRSSYDFSTGKRSTHSTRIRGWSMSNSSKASVIENWTKVQDQLKPISYRKDVILFLNKLERGIRAVDSIQPRSSVFNLSAASDINDLITYRK